MSCEQISAQCFSPVRRDCTYVNPEVCVQQHLEFERLLALVLHIQHRLQSVSCQRHAIHQREVVAPRFLRVFAQLRGRQAEVELHAVVAARRELARLGGALA